VKNQSQTWLKIIILKRKKNKEKGKEEEALKLRKYKF
jgi:hypothetical protein